MTDKIKTHADTYLEIIYNEEVRKQDEEGLLILPPEEDLIDKGFMYTKDDGTKVLKVTYRESLDEEEYMDELVLMRYELPSGSIINLHIGDPYKVSFNTYEEGHGSPKIKRFNKGHFEEGEDYDDELIFKEYPWYGDYIYNEEPTEADDTTVVNTSGFIKYDNGKPMVSLVEPQFTLGVGKVLTFGAEKYERENWKLLSEDERYRIKDATYRHLLKYLDGEKLDEETGLSHLYHLTANAMFLDYFDRKGD